MSRFNFKEETKVCLRLSFCSVLPSRLPLVSPVSLSPPPSLRAHEPGHLGVGDVDGLRVGQRSAVADGRHAHPPPLHPEEQRGLPPHRLPVQPEPGGAALHAGCPAAGPTQRHHADAGGGAALAEVHRVLRHRVRYVTSDLCCSWPSAEGRCLWL